MRFFLRNARHGNFYYRNAEEKRFYCRNALDKDFIFGSIENVIFLKKCMTWEFLL